MRVQMAELGKGLLRRGVYVLPAKAPGGGMYAFAVTSDNQVTPSGVITLRWGSNLDFAAESLVNELEQLDPVNDEIRRSMLRVG